MKIKKTGKILSVICVFTLLYGCAANDESASGESSSVKSSEEQTSSVQTNSSDIFSDESSANTSSESEPQRVDIGDGMTLIGTPVESNKLDKFSLKLNERDWLWSDAEDEFVESLDIPGLKEICRRAVCLAQYCISPIDIDVAPNTYENDRKPAYIITSGETRYKCYEMGYTSESFYNEYLKIFTQETFEQMFKEYNYFIDYNGELFANRACVVGSPTEVRREFELISKSNTAIEFRRISFQHNMAGKPATEYIPELRSEYDISITEFKFVKTDDGWRAANLPVEHEADNLL